MHNAPKFSDWIVEGVKVFVVVFVLGKLINRLFVKLQRRLRLKNSIVFGLAHLLFILVFSYFLHVFTSQKFSEEMSITSPSVLYSGLLLNLQSNLFSNLGV